MLSLSDVQDRLRDAIVEDATGAILPLLVGGRDPAKRLAVHRRHYTASLARALLDKFPAVTWLMGASFMTEAARAFVHRHPPTAPCIAEYGGNFPTFLTKQPGAERIPYLRSFAELEWHLGHVAIAIDGPSLAMAAFENIEASALPDIRLTLQPGLHYTHAAWPVDDLIKLYLNGTNPDRTVFEPASVHIELRGARGDFRIERLDPANFVSRRALAEGQTIGAAAEQALECDAAFDPGRALTTLVGDGLVTAFAQSSPGTGA